MDIYDIIFSIQQSVDDEKSEAVLSEVVNILEGDTNNLEVIDQAGFHLAMHLPQEGHLYVAYCALTNWRGLLQTSRWYS